MNWAIGVPLAAVCAFALDLGLVGLQVGFSIAMVGSCIGYVLILACKDRQEISDEVAARIEKEATNI